MSRSSLDPWSPSWVSGKHRSMLKTSAQWNHVLLHASQICLEILWTQRRNPQVFAGPFSSGPGGPGCPFLSLGLAQVQFATPAGLPGSSVPTSIMLLIISGHFHKCLLSLPPPSARSPVLSAQ